MNQQALADVLDFTIAQAHFSPFGTFPWKGHGLLFYWSTTQKDGFRSIFDVSCITTLLNSLEPGASLNQPRLKATIHGRPGMFVSATETKNSVYSRPARLCSSWVLPCFCTCAIRLEKSTEYSGQAVVELANVLYRSFWSHEGRQGIQDRYFTIHLRKGLECVSNFGNKHPEPN